MGKTKSKTKYWVIPLVVIVVLALGLGIWYNTQETGLPEFQKSGISCSTVNDCSNYLSTQGVSQENINKVEFKCDGVCYFKEK